LVLWSYIYYFRFWFGYGDISFGVGFSFGICLIKKGLRNPNESDTVSEQKSETEVEVSTVIPQARCRIPKELY
jgi:hypothetical protein